MRVNVSRTRRIGLALGLVLAAGGARARDVQLCFLHVNDSHGVGVTPDGRGDCRLARVATVVRQARAGKGPDAVFVTVGGDIGVHPHDEDYLTNATDALAEVLAFNLLGVDAMTPGNHEFDNHCDWTEKLMAASKFPWIAANVYHKGTTKHYTTGGGHVVREVAGVKVALFGLSPGPKSGEWNVLRGGDRIDARDEIEVGREIVPRLRERADVVVGVTHIGLDKDRNLANAAAPDLILGGHSHSEAPGTVVGGTRIAQARWHHEFVARADVTVTPAGGKWRVSRLESRLVPTAGAAPDPDMVALLLDFRSRAENGVSLLAPLAFATTPGLSTVKRPTSFRAVGRGFVSWRWEFGDGSAGGGERVAHAYARAGLHTVTLTATDADGKELTCSAPVLVIEGIDEARYSPGLKAEFFDLATAPSSLPDLDALKPDLERTDPQISYPKTNAPWDGLPAAMADTFASRHTGYVKTDEPGDYVFYLSSDDGSKLWLDGELLVTNDGLHGMQERSATRRLEAGYHALRVEYFEGAGTSGLVLSFSGPGVGKRVVPAAILCTERERK